MNNIYYTTIRYDCNFVKVLYHHHHHGGVKHKKKPALVMMYARHIHLRQMNKHVNTITNKSIIKLNKRDNRLKFYAF